MTDTELQDALDSVLRFVGQDGVNLFNHLLSRMSGVEQALGITVTQPTSDTPSEDTQQVASVSRGRRTN